MPADTTWLSLLRVLAAFVFLYPAVMAVGWIVGGLGFWRRRERAAARAAGEASAGEAADRSTAWPAVTVVIPSRNEAASIIRTLDHLSELDYPDYRVLVVDDGSTDGTVAAVQPYIERMPFFHLLRMEENLGKAAALNAALSIMNTGLFLVVDADTIIQRDSLRHFVRPFLSQPRLAAVSGHPLPENRRGLLGNVQTAEFAAIIGLIKRSQRVWSRILTVSGCATMYRTDSVRRVGGFSSRTATDDIDITWRLQRNHEEVWFEPRATVLIQVPLRVREYLRQRYRWALGGWHLLRTHRSVWAGWRHRRLWPVYAEFALSYFWAFCFVGFSVAWAISVFIGYPLPGLSPIPAWHGSVLSLLCVTQMTVAALINRSYDRGLGAALFWVPWYPLLFFTVGAGLAVWTAPRGLLGRLDDNGRWKSPERSASPSRLSHNPSPEPGVRL